MPNHIRENLPEELSDLPADLIYATNITCHEFSYSADALRSVEARESLKEELRVRCGGMWSQWPGWAVHAAMRAHDEYVREEADEEAGRRSGRISSPDEETDAGSYLWPVDDDGRIVVDESDEEAGEEDPQSNPAP